MTEDSNPTQADNGSPPDAHTTMWLGIVAILSLTGLAALKITGDPTTAILTIFTVYAGLRYIIPKVTGRLAGQ
jgi:hypothetical protein